MREDICKHQDNTIYGQSPLSTAFSLTQDHSPLSSVLSSYGWSSEGPRGLSRGWQRHRGPFHTTELASNRTGRRLGFLRNHSDPQCCHEGGVAWDRAN